VQPLLVIGDDDDVIKGRLKLGKDRICNRRGGNRDRFGRALIDNAMHAAKR